MCIILEAIYHCVTPTQVATQAHHIASYVATYVCINLFRWKLHFILHGIDPWSTVTLVHWLTAILPL